MHLIRLQAAIDLQPLIEQGAYIMEQDINNYLIAKHEPEEKEEEEATLTSQQKRDATLEKVREAKAKQSFFLEMARTKTWPKPAPVRPPPEKYDWDFLYRSLQALPDTRAAILTRMCSGTTPVFKAELCTQRATTLSERIGKRQHAMQAAIRKQRNVNAIIDTGAQVTTRVR
jgi:hypothetical protein